MLGRTSVQGAQQPLHSALSVAAIQGSSPLLFLVCIWSLNAIAKDGLPALIMGSWVLALRHLRDAWESSFLEKESGSVLTELSSSTMKMVHFCTCIKVIMVAAIFFKITSKDCCSSNIKLARSRRTYKGKEKKDILMLAHFWWKARQIQI